MQRAGSPCVPVGPRPEAVRTPLQRGLPAVSGPPSVAGWSGAHAAQPGRALVRRPPPSRPGQAVCQETQDVEGRRVAPGHSEEHPLVTEAGRPPSRCGALQ
eukprot:7087931-Pyramimonas_sp.AAC.1